VDPLAPAILSSYARGGNIISHSAQLVKLEDKKLKI
jgi:hypothetical protein